MPVELLFQTHACGRLPVVLFAAGTFNFLKKIGISPTLLCKVVLPLLPTSRF